DCIECRAQQPSKYEEPVRARLQRLRTKQTPLLLKEGEARSAPLFLFHRCAARFVENHPDSLREPPLLQKEGSLALFSLFLSAVGLISTRHSMLLWLRCFLAARIVRWIDVVETQRSGTMDLHYDRSAGHGVVMHVGIEKCKAAGWESGHFAFVKAISHS